MSKVPSSLSSHGVGRGAGWTTAGFIAAMLAACGAPTSDVGAQSSAILTSSQPITAAATVVNRYGALALSAPAGSTVIAVTPAGMTSLGLAKGDLILLYEAQGATIDTSDTATYGTVSSLANAGNYEIATVGAVDPVLNTITLDTGCTGGLKHAYSTGGHGQVVYVPQYDSLAVSGSGSITGKAWDGSSGGVVVVRAQTLALGGAATGSINADGIGFRGGVYTNTGSPDYDYKGFRTTTTSDGAEKGEGVAGFEDALDTNGRYDRGAAANGGGGGNAHDSGGGGGANATSGNAWTGQGYLLASVAGAAAWALDPEYISNDNKDTTSSGGGAVATATRRTTSTRR